MGNALQLIRGDGPTAPAWRRRALYGAGTLSMLVLTTGVSLSLWIALPWAFLGWSPTLVTSGSMAPSVSPGDVVMLRPVSADDLHPDTVVLYDRPDSGRVLHRIVEVLPDGAFRTRGDANVSADSTPVQAGDVRSVAVLAVPWIGRPSLWLRDGQVLSLAAGGGVLLLLLSLAPRAFDTSFDPWGAGRRVNPAEVVFGTADAGRPDNGSHLLPEVLRDAVMAQLAGQSAAATLRSTQLLEGLS